MYRIKRLWAEEEFRLFDLAYQAKGGKPIDLVYMRKSRVWGIYVGPELAGGFIESDKLERASSLGLPKSHLISALRAAGADESECYEISCYFLDGRKCTSIVSFSIPLFMTFRLLMSRSHRYFIVSSPKIGLQKAYEAAGGRLILESGSPDGSGETRKVYIFSRLAILKASVFCTKRALTSAWQRKKESQPLEISRHSTEKEGSACSEEIAQSETYRSGSR